MPELSALQTKWKNQPIQIIGIGVDSLENIQQFQKQYRIQFPLYAAGMDGIDISRNLGNKTMGLPFTAIINHKGDIVKTYSGRLEMKQLQGDIAKLTATPQ
jgi:peroxiredoxin